MKNINPNWQKSSVVPRSTAYYETGITSGDVVVLSAAITLIESQLGAHQVQADALMAALKIPQKTVRIGITGVPGVGKSTFIEAFGLHLVAQGRRLAVLTVDPSSQISGGSILGDKTRMELLARHERAFVRPSAAGANLGGLARNTKRAVLLCEAAGFDTVLVETVGVGQSEVEVSKLTDFFVLLALTGAGDELQGIKRGILELADAIVINKNDGENKAKIEITKAIYANSMHLFVDKPSHFPVKILDCSALNQTGIAPIWELIQAYAKHATENGYWAQNRKNQLHYWVEKELQHAVLNEFYGVAQIKTMLQEAKNNSIFSDNDANLLIKNILAIWHKK